jgi:quinol-cytochrome oxidoreductase complex cytochrome b subunit
VLLILKGKTDRNFIFDKFMPSETKQYKKPAFKNLILHLHPARVDEQTLKFTLTWGLGGMALTLTMLLIFTGVLLMFVYEPSPDRAYDSIVALRDNVWFGQLVRNIHRWSGDILIIVVLMHLLRVFFTGAFRDVRRTNWIIGLFLLLIVLAANFTGYLLPWDQLAFWATSICTGMVEYIPGIGAWLQEVIKGGADIGPATLLIFFTLHCTLIPLCLVLLMAFHFWYVRKAGGVVIPRSADEKHLLERSHVPTIPNLVDRELAVGLSLIAFVFVFSLVFDAPLEAKANPGMSLNPAKAPWYFLGLQELLIHFHPLFAVFIIPFLALAALLALPYLKHDSDTAGIWFCSHQGRRTGMIAALFAGLIIPAGIIGDEFFIDLAAWLPSLPPAISNGLVPFCLLSGVLAGFYALVKRRYAATDNEAIQALFIFLLVSLVVLTVVGIWFRGPGMTLTWPGQMETAGG